MSLKSGLSIGGSRESPGVEGELPHHGQPLGRGGGGAIPIGRVVREWEDTDGCGSLRHPCSNALARSQWCGCWGPLTWWDPVMPAVSCFSFIVTTSKPNIACYRFLLHSNLCLLVPLQLFVAISPFRAVATIAAS